MNKSHLLAFLLLPVLSLPVSAAVIEGSDVLIGGDTYQTFRDDTTSLIWLDLDSFWDGTTTYNSLISLLDGSGFHLATLPELEALLLSMPAVPANFAVKPDKK